MKIKPEIILIGGSAGSLEVLIYILSHLSMKYVPPIVVLIHTSENNKSNLVEIINFETPFHVQSIQNFETIFPNKVYITPPMYHLQIERDLTFSFSLGPKLNFSRPSLDILFESAAEAYKSKTLAIILSGASTDGTDGAIRIAEFGGTIVVQDPLTAEVPIMPLSVINNVDSAIVLKTEEIVQYLNYLMGD